MEFEISMYLKSVGARSFHAVYTSERDSRGTIKGFVASVTDISDQRKADALIAADMRAMTLLQEVSSECVREGASMDECLHHIVDAAITIVGADKGNLQTINRNTGTLNIAAQRRFQDQFNKFFKSMQDDAVSARAMQSGKPVIVEDVTSSEIFIKAPSQKVLLDAGVCGVISTPLMNSKGIPLGTVSTHFRQPHQPSERELRLVGLLARQAADYLERKRSEEIQKTLNYEIQHRANNLLAIVQSIARRTLSGDHTLSQAREAFEARLEAVARANLRLTKSNWSGLDLTEIVQTELKPFYDRVKNEGPIVTLDPQQGQNLALALHELATNAAKYGAFSNASGTVRVFWTIMRGDDGSSLLNFKWQEGGGPPVIVPTRRGFGSKLISATSPNVRFNYLPEGTQLRDRREARCRDTSEVAGALGPYTLLGLDEVVQRLGMGLIFHRVSQRP